MVVNAPTGAKKWDKGELIEVLVSLKGFFDGEEAVDELDHALQCAALAMADGAAPHLVAAALLHDVGRSSSVQAEHPGLPHEQAGAAWLRARGHEDVAWLVEAHVPAKVWLVAHDATYGQGLSPESKASLERQQGADLGAWEPDSRWPDAVRLRRWDDQAKVPGAPTPRIPQVLAAFCVSGPDK